MSRQAPKIKALRVFEIHACGNVMGEIYAGHLPAELRSTLADYVGEAGMAGRNGSVLVDLHTAFYLTSLPPLLYQLYAEALSQRYDWLWISC